MSAPASVGRTAFLLGFAGLLPQIVGIAFIVIGRRDPTDLAWIPLSLGIGIASVYPALILSFLGGVWWGFAMRRTARQARLAALAVTPSLVGLACVGATGMSFESGGVWVPLVVLGVALLLTLIVDGRLAKSGEAPANWMRLRTPLSVGLGLLTIVAGALLAF